MSHTLTLHYIPTPSLEVVSSAMLAWDEPLLEKGSTTYVVLKYSDILFTFLFLAELIMKVSQYQGDGERLVSM